jgi:hypothetical protein
VVVQLPQRLRHGTGLVDVIEALLLLAVVFQTNRYAAAAAAAKSSNAASMSGLTIARDKQ